MLEELCKRIQHCCATLRRSRNEEKCWELLAEKFDRFQTLRNNTPQHPTTRNRVCKRTQQVTSNNVAPVCTGLNLRQPWRNAGQRMHCFRANTWYRSENPRAVCVFESPVLIPSSTNRRLDHFHPFHLSHLPAGTFYCMLLRKIITQRNFLCLLSKIIQKASLAHHNFFLALKRDRIQVCMLNVHGLKFAYKTTKFYAKWLVRNFGQKHELQYLDKICCVKSRFQILYIVEQFSSLFSKDKLKHGAHIHQTHDPPSPRTSWMCGHCRAVPIQQLSHTCVVWSWHLKDWPRQERDFYTRVFPGH